jgi:hypothetical protein
MILENLICPLPGNKFHHHQAFWLLSFLSCDFCITYVIWEQGRGCGQNAAKNMKIMETLDVFVKVLVNLPELL